jgi:hypothetical protein
MSFKPVADKIGSVPTRRNTTSVPVQLSPPLCPDVLTGMSWGGRGLCGSLSRLPQSFDSSHAKLCSVDTTSQHSM